MKNSNQKRITDAQFYQTSIEAISNEASTHSTLIANTIVTIEKNIEDMKRKGEELDVVIGDLVKQKKDLDNEITLYSNLTQRLKEVYETVE